jgi:hypothetical protein
MSFQMVFASLFVSILAIRRRSHPLVIDPAEEAANVVDAAVHRVRTERGGATSADTASDADIDSKDPAKTA